MMIRLQLVRKLHDGGNRHARIYDLGDEQERKNGDVTKEEFVN